MSFTQAQAQHRAGRLDKAEPLYRAHLKAHPDDEEALFWLAALLSYRGKHTEAVSLYEQVLKRSPDDPDANLGMGIGLLAEGRFLEAEIALSAAAQETPDAPEPLYYLGTAAFRQGQPSRAETLYRQALSLKPDFLEALQNLTEVLTSQHRTSEAEAFNRQLGLLKARPASRPKVSLPKRTKVKSESVHDLGVLAEAADNEGNHEAALEITARALAKRADHPGILKLRAKSLSALKRFAEAEAAARILLKSDQDDLDGLSLLGQSLVQQNKAEEGIEVLQKVVERRPLVAEHHSNLGVAFTASRRIPEALAALEKAVLLRPEFHAAQKNLGSLHLIAGDYSEGWNVLGRISMIEEIPREFGVPQWDGSELSGKTILLHMTEGFGDNLQFVRYLPEVKKRVGRVVLESYAELKPLVERTPGYDLLVTREKSTRPPEGVSFDVHLDLLDLPRVLRVTPETLTAPRPYLFASESKGAEWRKRLASDGGPCVGLIWSGRAGFANDHNRSLKLADFGALASLSETHGIHFYSLQQGAKSAEGTAPPPGMRLTDLTADLHTFDDTAALLMNLDLLLTVDTAGAHLAGGLGRPVWTLLPFFGDWRWGLEGETTPWYPTMRLFRQPSAGDWTSVFADLREALKPWAEERG